MGLPNKDEVEGKFDQAKGAVKENVGRAVMYRKAMEQPNVKLAKP